MISSVYPQQHACHGHAIKSSWIQLLIFLMNHVEIVSCVWEKKGKPQKCHLNREHDDLLGSGVADFQKKTFFCCLVGGLEHLLWLSIYWETSSQLTNIFQRGSNHQPVYICCCFPGIFDQCPRLLCPSGTEECTALQSLLQHPGAQKESMA